MLGQRARADRSFERIYRRHVSDVYRYALAVLANPADAEDVTQTTFLNAYRAYRQGQRPERPGNWLIVIAQNVCRQRFRQAARRPGEVELDDDIGAELVEDEPPLLEDVPIALFQLAFNQRAALVMREVHGYSYAEIARALDLSQSAVETLLFRARRAFREQLESRLTCDEAERAISRQLDGQLGRREKAVLRGHLRSCSDCATLARRLRAQRAGLKAFVAVPLPSSLATFFGGGGATVGGGAAMKAAAFSATALLIGGGGYAAVDHAVPHRGAHPHKDAAAHVRQHAPNVSVRAAAAPARVTALPTLVARHPSAPDTRPKAAKARKSKARHKHQKAATPVLLAETVVAALPVAAKRTVHSHPAHPHTAAAVETGAAKTKGSSASATGHLKIVQGKGKRPDHPVHGQSDAAKPGKARASTTPTTTTPTTTVAEDPAGKSSANGHAKGKGSPHTPTTP